ncbi:hypothetical protein Kpol_1067p12 [Vanderwaltozyma polyspora DSM 70294]|uniref:Alpha/beta hydrolase fold-3 domain-containing protein n=1 Tax=Vanderwaltozyma polyspora (strain ATCC 22028 / DSM 70294 / BCRC 21397 / CBS 2163 / NBRC 10782 / NRRL Y-8283 / UCD 57-17) TaxID=436907 RepID=A7TNV7_VANPO|nr:uncharacterized protein Kpol_1067p12 [Vanderwaltozyma polyspora DSM 70294]EDO16040.1 hypothetical protein Kpol_1067p12 [Vanderwaltozyma polyspora DSM 70294]
MRSSVKKATKMNLRGLWFLFKIIFVLPIKQVLRSIGIVVFNKRKLDGDMLGRIFMRESFLLADKYSCNGVINPLLDFLSGVYRKFSGFPTTEMNQIECDLIDLDTSVFNQRLLNQHIIKSDYEWYYKPEKFDPKVDPVLLYFHGGGFALKLIPVTLVFLNNLRQYYPRMAIVMSDYTVTDALNHNTTYPLQNLQSILLYKYFTEMIGCKKVYLMGESAGGNMVLSLLVYLQKCGKVLPKKAIAVSPWVNPAILSEEEKTFMKDDKLDSVSIKGLDLCKKLYAPNNEYAHEYLTEPFLNVEYNYEYDVWHGIVEKCQLLITYGDDEILQMQIKSLIDKITELKKNSFSEGKNVYIDVKGGHIRPLLKITSDISKWSKLDGVKEILNFIKD